MQIPVIRGIIDRRILVNFRIDADAVAKLLPAPFRPKIVSGFAIGGICLIRLKAIRPRFIPLPWGMGSENAAHRIAVEWELHGKKQEGVYIPRRDTDSRLNAWAGGTIFPGFHHHANFSVKEDNDHFSIAFQSDDDTAHALVSGKVTEQPPSSSVFSSLEDASRFFQLGSLGYSATKTEGRFDGLELRCKDWRIEALEVDKIESSFFENRAQLPLGTVEFDSAFLMRNIDHEWHSRKEICSASL